MNCSSTSRRVNRRWQRPIIAILVTTAVLAFAARSSAQVNVIMSGGFAAAYQEVLPNFEQATGIKVITGRGASQGDGPNTIRAQLRRGVPADVVILSREGLADLIVEGRILAGTDIDLAQTPIGVAVRAGAPKPDISTVDSLKQTLLSAKSVTFSSSTTGLYLTTKLFPRLGIADEMKRKSTTSGVAVVASGDAEIAVQPVSELLHVTGVDFVGTIPAEIQHLSVFAAAVVAGSKEPEASKRLIAFLASTDVEAAIEKSGMEPSKRR
jgi:molybdate transport system substrate-binding protein